MNDRVIDDLRRRLDLEHAVAAIAVRFITLRCDEIDAAVAEALRRIGTLAGADRSYVFRMRLGGRIADNTHEWCADGITAMRDSLQGLDLDAGLPWFAARIRELRAMGLATVDLPPEAAAERALLESQGVRSVVIAPIVESGQPVGFIGFDAVRSCRAWNDEDAALLGTIGEILVSTWARQRTEAALRDAEQHWRALTENSGATVITLDADLRIRSMNRVVEGFSLDRVIGTPALDYLSPHVREATERAYRRAFATGQPEVIEVEGQGANGTTAWYETRLVPLARAGVVVELVLVATDITERVRIQNTLRRNEARLRAAFDASPLGVLIARGGLLLYVNPAYVRIFGFTSASELVGTPLIERVVPEQRAHAAERLAKRERNESLADSYDVLGLRRTGEIFPCHVNSAHIDLEDGAAVLVFIADTSEKRRAEQALRESEARFQAFMDHSPLIAFLKDAESRFVYANGRYLQQFGISMDELRGKALHDLFPPAVAARLAEKDALVLRTDQVHESIEVVPAYDGSKPRSWLVIKFPVRDSAGRRYV
ncbi:MAG: PAS domain S-box protein, partial [Planctomycetes bacterium]|nr:PAS domain S-box protein [Planctomycetota bacterium]